jgi:2-phosphosulfolactate phosphatase
LRVVTSSLRQGAQAARGVAVIVDVYRAFSCTALLFSLGAEAVILMGSPEEAFAYRKQNPRALLVGEVRGRPIPGFDLPNSPSEILRMEEGFFLGRKIVQRTSSGVQGALLALDGSDVIFLGSYLNARATARAVQALGAELVHIVAMGREMLERTPEDEWCARYLACLLGSGTYDHLEALRQILRSPETGKFLEGGSPHYPAADPLICLQRDILDLALAARREGDLAVVRAQQPAAGSPPRGA